MFTSILIINQQLNKQSGNKGIIGGANTASISIMNALDSFYTSSTNNINDATLYCTTLRSNTNTISSVLINIQDSGENNLV